MKFKSILMGAVALCFVTAPAMAEKITITNNQVLELIGALTALDGQQVSVKDGAAEKVIIKPYDFAPSFRQSIGRNLTRLKAERDAFGLARDQLIKGLSGGTGKIEPDTPAYLTFNLQMQELTLSKIEVDVFPFDEDELKLDKNPISGSVHSGLDPLFKKP